MVVPFMEFVMGWMVVSAIYCLFFGLCFLTCEKNERISPFCRLGVVSYLASIATLVLIVFWQCFF
jgi:hypothetical protein